MVVAPLAVLFYCVIVCGVVLVGRGCVTGLVVTGTGHIRVNKYIYISIYR